MYRRPPAELTCEDVDGIRASERTACYLLDEQTQQHDGMSYQTTCTSRATMLGSQVSWAPTIPSLWHI
eukprot:6192974-Pleurochrysis_carterae.AAC.2